MPSSDFLAVAFTDLNGNHKYNAGKDTLIAALVDTNHDGVPSIGDTVHWGTYPAILDGSASGVGGKYLSPDSLVLGVTISSTFIEARTAGGTVDWFKSPNLEGFITSSPMQPVPESSLTDSINFLTTEDRIFTTPGNVGQPNQPLDVHTLQPGNQGFLDVWLFF